MRLRTRPKVIAQSTTIKRTSRSGKPFSQTQIKTECLKRTFTCKPRCSKLPLESPESLAILAFATLLRPVSPHALALFLALSIGGVLGDGALRCSFNPANVLPSCPAGFVGSSSVLPPLLGASLGACSGGVLLAVLRPLLPYTLAFLRCALGRFLGQWCLTFQRSSWRC